MKKLFHGTNTDFDSIDLTKSKPFKDFGRGFYLTDIHHQALEMAKRRSIRNGGLPVVQTYLFDENHLADRSLKVKIFEGVSEEWANFIIDNRKGKLRLRDNYDIVIGPIADDGVVFQIERYLNRMIDMNTLIQELTYRQLNRQYFFGTQKSINLLKRCCGK